MKPAGFAEISMGSPGLSPWDDSISPVPVDSAPPSVVPVPLVDAVAVSSLGPTAAKAAPIMANVINIIKK